MTVKWFLWG